MKIEYKEFCSNPECNHTVIYGPTEPSRKFCTVCGNPMITKCSSCGATFLKDTQNYCSECSTPIKNASKPITDEAID